VDETTTAKLRSEEMEHSQIMRIEHMLTDRYGPRVTGTPNPRGPAADQGVRPTTCVAFDGGKL
jgi:hypothetical protein